MKDLLALAPSGKSEESEAEASNACWFRNTLHIDTAECAGSNLVVTKQGSISVVGSTNQGCYNGQSLCCSVDVCRIECHAGNGREHNVLVSRSESRSK